MSSERKPYMTPELYVHGDVADITRETNVGDNFDRDIKEGEPFDPNVLS